MGLPEILDAATRKVAGIAGIAGASGAGLASDVPGMPMEMPTTPYAVGYLNPGTGTQGLSTTVLVDEIEFRVYVPKAALPGGYAVLLGFPDLFEQAWRTDRDLEGTCLDSWYAGHGKVDIEDWGTPELPLSYLVLAIRIGVRRRLAADFSS
jgi:hypothetical protein